MKILAPLAGTKALVYFYAGPSLAELASHEQWRYLYDLEHSSNTMFAAMVLFEPTFQAFVIAMGRPPYSYVIPLGVMVLDNPDSTDPNPPEALAPGVEGYVQFRVTVGPAGRIQQNAQFIGGNPSLESMARQMLAQFVYKPSGASHGNPAWFETRADVRFAVDRRPATRASDTIEMPDGAADSRANREAPDSPPTLLRKVEPEYPLEVRASGLQGIVALSATIGTDGIPKDIQVLRSPPGGGSDEEALRAAALKAASQWRFAPARDNSGQPVESPVTLQMTFRLM
jgi:TonB family protein